MNTQSIYETIIDTLTKIKNDIESDYTGIDSLWDTDGFRSYCEAVGATRTDVIEALLVSLDRHIASVPAPIEEDDKYKTEELPQIVVEPKIAKPVLTEPDTDDYKRKFYRPAGQYRVMECVSTRTLIDKRLMLGFDINPHRPENPDSDYNPWLQFYPVDDCVLISAEQERAA